MVIIKLNYDNIAFCGDIHGNFSKLVNYIKIVRITNCVIFICGDFGIGFNKEQFYIDEFNKLSKILEKHNVLIAAIRGNHDNPKYFKEIKYYGNFLLIPDYTIIEVNNKNILALGGAISVDRYQRKIDMQKQLKYAKTIKHECYWVDEEFILNENILSNTSNIDIVFSHSCPSFCPPFTKGIMLDYIDRDKSLIEDCAKERINFTKAFDIIYKYNPKLSNWYYGHFHSSHKINVNDVNFTCLDIMEIYMINSGYDDIFMDK